MLNKLKNAFRTVSQAYWVWYDLPGGKHLAILFGSVLIFGLGSAFGDMIHNPERWEEKEEEGEVVPPAAATENIAFETFPAGLCGGDSGPFYPMIIIKEPASASEEAEAELAFTVEGG